MKRNKFFNWFLTALLLAAFIFPATAQDDLYYDPATDGSVKTSTGTYSGDPSGDNVTKRYDGDDYDDESYVDEDDYEYEYSSRIRRFHRRNPVVYDYYDPFYTDLYFYDPFYLPGASIYVVNYNDFGRWNRWNRRRHWNDWGWGNSFYGGYNSWCGWNVGGGGWGGGWGSPWNNVYVYNNYYYDPYWTWNGYNPYYCPSYNQNNYYYNNGNQQNNGGNYSPKTYVGVRRGGTTVNPNYARIDDGRGRLTPTGKGDTPVIELAGKKNGRTIVSDKEPDAVERKGNARVPSTTNPNGDVRADDRSGRTRPETERPRDGRSETEPARPNREVETERPRRNDAETTRPSREVQPERPRRNDTETTRPSREVQPERPRRNDTENTRPARRKDESSNSDLRPSRSSGSSSDDRPSRSESRSSRSESRTFDNGSSRSSERGSSSGGSSGSSRGSSGSSSGGGKKNGRD